MRMIPLMNRTREGDDDTVSQDLEPVPSSKIPLSESMRSSELYLTWFENLME